MIDFYTWPTPNGRKVSILLEELGIPYKIYPIDISIDEQFTDEFITISPNNKIPAIFDSEKNIALMESGAIMLYLAQKYDKFIVKGDEYWHMIEWLMWQMAGLGPMLGQVHHFGKYNKGKSLYAEERYSREAHRLYGVLNSRLSGKNFIVGDGKGEYTIADMAIWPWISRFEWQNINLNDYIEVKRWYISISGRSAVKRGYHAAKYISEIPIPSEE